MRWIDAHDRVIAQLDFESLEEAERALRTLGLDVARPARELSMVPRAFAFSTAFARVFALSGAVTLATVVAAGIGWFSILSFPFVFVLAGAAMSGRVRVGDDGFEIRSVIGRRRFVGFREIASVEREHGEVEVRLKSGESIKLAVAGARRGKWQRAHADAIVNALRRGLARGHAPLRRGLEQQLARGDRDEDKWHHSLRTLSHENGYRGASISNDDLLAVLAHPNANPSAREGAAVVLQTRGVDSNTLRKQALSSAHPKVRVALMNIADESDEHEDEHEDVNVVRQRKGQR